jgi:hypothetical protein
VQVDRSGRDAQIIADAQGQVKDLDREMACASEELTRLIGNEPATEMERFKLIDAPGTTSATGTKLVKCWSRVTLKGVRVERYIRANSVQRRGTSAFLD